MNLIRHQKNPIITPDDMPFKCYTVMNAGATIFEGKVLLLLRVENCERQTNFYVATSENGVDFDISDTPIVYPLCKTEERYNKVGRSVPCASCSMAWQVGLFYWNRYN